jgi:hypothetical protein
LSTSTTAIWILFFPFLRSAGGNRPSHQSIQGERRQELLSTSCIASSLADPLFVRRPHVLCDPASPEFVDLIPHLQFVEISNHVY